MVALAGVRLASALRMAGRLDEAEAVLAEVGTPKAGVVRAREQLAWALLHQGELVRAAEHLTRAEEQAVTAQDWPGRAHAIELLGVEGGRTPSPGGARHWSCTGSSARTGARHVACSTRVPRPCPMPRSRAGERRHTACSRPGRRAARAAGELVVVGRTAT
jgi:hypothetical protein